MIYYDVLQRKHKELWDLVSLLSDKRVISSEKTLCEDLEISEFVLEQRLKDLNQSWKHIFGYELFDMSKLLIEDIYISDNQELIYKQGLLEQSLTNKMLLELLFDCYDLENFIKKNNVSQASVYRMRREVQDSLEKWGVSINKDRAIGSELTIRNLIMSILNFRELDYLLYADANLIAKVEQAVNVCADHYQLNLRPSQRDLLTNVLFLAKVRQSKGHFHTKLVSVKYTQKDAELVEKLAPYLPVPVDVVAYETDQLLLFLYTYDLLHEIDLEDTLKVRTIDDLDREFRQMVMMVMDVDHLPQAKFEKMFQECRQIHWRNLLFQNFFNGFSFMNDRDWAGVSQRLFEAIDQLYQKYQILPNNFEDQKDRRYSLYSDYFFTLAKYINDEESLPQVNVCVDFSQSSIMYDLTERLFEVLWFCNLNVQDNLDEQTQLYISDRHLAKVDVPQLIWTGPPHYRELLVLTRLVNQIAGRTNEPSDERVNRLLDSISNKK